MARSLVWFVVALAFTSWTFLQSPQAFADSISDRQVLAVFKAGTVNMPAELDSSDLTQVISIESDLGQILTSFGIGQLVRAFPDFDLADTLGLSYGSGYTERMTDWSKVWLLTVQEGASRDSLVAALLVIPSTVVAEPNGTGIGFAAPRYPNDAHFVNGDQWGLWVPAATGSTDADVNATWGWGGTTGTSLMRIGIVDGGFTSGHPDLGSRVVLDNGESEFSQHAYRVAGVIGAITNNGVGIAGTNWNSGLVSRIGGHQQSEATTVEAINFLGRIAPGAGNCRIINASWGLVTNPNQFPYYSILLEAAFKDHLNRNGTSVCSIGNRGIGGARDWPGNLHGVISVGAIDQSNARWVSSSSSPRLDLVAPGVGIWTTDSNGAYAQETGTSVATAFVTGAASLLLAKDSTLAAADVENLLKLSADDLPPTNTPPELTRDLPAWNDSLTGAGRLNISRALNIIDPPNRLVSMPIAVPQSAITKHLVNQYGPTTVYSFPGVDDGVYDNISIYECTYHMQFTDYGYSFSRAPIVWGQNTRGPNGLKMTGLIDFGGTPIRIITDYRHCFVPSNEVDRLGCTIHTFVYYIPEIDQWLPPEAAPGQSFVFILTALEVWPTPDMSRSYFVPQIGPVGSPTEGTTAIRQFKTCPNNDPGSFPASARIKVVLQDAVGNGLGGISPEDIFVLMNGGTPSPPPVGQGFVGDGADSVISDPAYTGGQGCPTLRTINADAATDGSGTTYITFGGSVPGSPGVGVRNPNRKWGHFDTELPVYVLGKKLSGRITSSAANGTYALQIKNYDFTYSDLGTTSPGENVGLSDFNYMSNHVANQPGPLNYWCDYDNSGFVSIADYNNWFNHWQNGNFHDCNYPLNP